MVATDPPRTVLCSTREPGLLSPPMTNEWAVQPTTTLSSTVLPEVPSNAPMPCSQPLWMKLPMMVVLVAP